MKNYLLPRISQKFRGRGVSHVCKSPKKKQFCPKLVKTKYHFGGRNYRKPTKPANFGVLALNLTHITKTQLLHWIREETSQCHLSVSNHEISLQNPKFLHEWGEFRKKCKIAVHSIENALWRYFSVPPRVMVNWPGHFHNPSANFANGRVAYKSWFGGSLAWLNPLLHSHECQILTKIHRVLLFLYTPILSNVNVCPLGALRFLNMAQAY